MVRGDTRTSLKAQGLAKARSSDVPTAPRRVANPLTELVVSQLKELRVAESSCASSRRR